MDKLSIVGQHDDRTVTQMRNCLRDELQRQAFSAPTVIWASVAWPLATAVAKRTQRLHGVWD
jgi:hypothetical protein